jgi:flotillin
MENERKQQMEQSTKDLHIARIDFQRQVEIAKAEGSAASEIRKADLEAEVQRKIALEQQERLRKESLAPAIVQYEVEAKKAETERTKTVIAAEAARSQQAISAEADKTAQQLRAEADAITVRTMASAESERIRAIAEANLTHDLKKAEGQFALAQAQAQGFERLVGAFGGNTSHALTALMTDKGLVKDVAEAQAKAVQGLNPKITVWTNTGDEASNAIRNVVQNSIPLLQTIKDQTGMDILPSVFTQSPSEAADAVAKAAKK